MESRSRVVTTNSNIFCVAKLDWQFIGNIRLRGVTPSFRVPCNQQKSPLSPSLSITPSPILAALHTLDASLLDRWNVWYPNRGGNDSIPLAAVNAPHWHCSLDRCNCCSRPHLHHLHSSRRGLEWPPDDIRILFAESAAASLSIRFDDFSENSSGIYTFLFECFFFSFRGFDENVIVLCILVAYEEENEIEIIISSIRNLLELEFISQKVIWNGGSWKDKFLVYEISKSWIVEFCRLLFFFSSLSSTKQPK